MYLENKAKTVLRKQAEMINQENNALKQEIGLIRSVIDLLLNFSKKARSG